MFAVAVFLLGPDWSTLADQAFHPRVTASEGPAVYWYYAIALFGAAMTPYEVFFFSSGGVEEKWGPGSLRTMRANVFIGFPLGGLLSIRGLVWYLSSGAAVSEKMVPQLFTRAWRTGPAQLTRAGLRTFAKVAGDPRPFAISSGAVALGT